ncbi:hypothetical protein M0R19_05040 [Candidatus Pacearchaeota archaeon]|nr:hypothetical protein [Candidatus Pacearchaeota archaeon]
MVRYGQWSSFKDMSNEEAVEEIKDIEGRIREYKRCAQNYLKYISFNSPMVSLNLEQILNSDIKHLVDEIKRLRKLK